MKAPYNKNKSIEEVENSILETILTTAIDGMSDNEKQELLTEMGGKAGLSIGGIATSTFIGIFRSGGFYSYQLLFIIANQIARAILGRGLMLATNDGLMRVASVLSGPVGWAISGIWTAVDLAGPAYIPVIIQDAKFSKS